MDIILPTHIINLQNYVLLNLRICTKYDVVLSYYFSLQAYLVGPLKLEAIIGKHFPGW